MDPEDMKDGLESVLIRQSIRSVSIADIAMQHSDNENLYVAPAGRGLADVLPQLQKKVGSELLLRRALEKEADILDFCIIDTSPKGDWLTMLAVSAADKLIIPMPLQRSATKHILELEERLMEIKENLDVDIETLGFLQCAVDKRDGVENRRTYWDVLDAFGEDTFLKTIIRKSTAIQRAERSGKSVVDFEPASRGAIDYDCLSEEVLVRLGLPTQKPKNKR
ncbi:sporulation initiation inhibitor protein Soj-like [Ylistrum balloti]|uniref:sporulation initiation inhibitor protein Soj-like n=1 Tax=Ylistrum balloti TaxID=509963 RepID=UPI00290594F4|nr:sporulation initiation inhibitor protein Soj-like [Ylistrum balloti]